MKKSPSMRGLVWLLSLAMVAGMGAVAVAQQAAEPATETAAVSQSPASNSVFHTISARVDKNVAGRIATLGPSGQFVPAKAKVTLVSEGRVVVSGMSDEMGNFQLPTVPAGNYSVVAAGSAGFGVASVRVVPYQPGVASPNLLDLTLAPYADYRVAANLAADQGPVADVPPMMVPGPAPVAEFGAPGAGFAAGGAGGGAGGLGALLGLSGLAGLAGVSGGGGDVIVGPASPAAP